MFTMMELPPPPPPPLPPPPIQPPILSLILLPLKLDFDIKVFQ